MKTQIINGITYKLVPASKGLNNCSGCVFDEKGVYSCSVNTGCIRHNYIYKKISNQPNTTSAAIAPIAPIAPIGNIWIVKEKESGKHVGYTMTREEAREIIWLEKFHKGFAYKPLVIVKGIVNEN